MRLISASEKYSTGNGFLILNFWPNLLHHQNKLPTPHQAIIKTDGITRTNPSISLGCSKKQKEGREQMMQVGEGRQTQNCAAI